MTSRAKYYARALDTGDQPPDRRGNRKLAAFPSPRPLYVAKDAKDLQGNLQELEKHEEEEREHADDAIEDYRSRMEPIKDTLNKVRVVAQQLVTTGITEPAPRAGTQPQLQLELQCVCACSCCRTTCTPQRTAAPPGHSGHGCVAVGSQGRAVLGAC